MSNKTRLQTNNTNLQALINKANALPDAGGSGGGSGDMCNVIITHSTKYAASSLMIYSIGADGSVVETVLESTTESCSLTTNSGIIGIFP